MRFLTYFAATSAYSAVHAAAHLYRRESIHWDAARRCDVRHPMLLSDKLAYGAFATMYGFILWPTFLHHDVRRIELRYFAPRPRFEEDDRHPLFVRSV